MQSSMLRHITEDFGNGGTIDGDLTISGDLTVSGGGSLSFDEILEGTQVIDVTNTEAFLIRKNGDGGDLLTIDTTNSRMLFSGELRLYDKDGDGTFGGRIRYDNSDNELRIESNEAIGLKLHFNEFVNTALIKNYKVGTYTLEEKSWIDIGNWLSYKNSIDKFSF